MRVSRVEKIIDALRLGKMSEVAGKQSIEALAKTLRHSQGQLRKAAAKAMGRMVNGRHERLVHTAERDSHPAVRYAAAKALR